MPNAAADKAEFYPWKWAQAVEQRRRHDGRSRNRHRPGGDLLPPRPAQAGRAAVRPGDAGAEVGARGTTSSTSASSTRRPRRKPSGLALRRQRGQHLLDRGLPGRRGLRRRPRVRRTSRTATACRTPGSTPPGGAGRHHGRAASSSPPPWNKAFSSGSFAALACPTWMMGYIQGQAGDSYAGKWDIAPVLPGGATNWGGSWLGVPDKAAHKAAGIALVEWLSSQGPAGDDVEATAGTSRRTPRRQQHQR